MHQSGTLTALFLSFQVVNCTHWMSFLLSAHVCDLKMCRIAGTTVMCAEGVSQEAGCSSRIWYGFSLVLPAWRAECLHGVKEDQHGEGGTIYPSPLGVAASWDEALVHKIGGQVRKPLATLLCFPLGEV